MMALWSIRRLMRVIAGIALILGVGVGLSRMPSGRMMYCRVNCQSNLRNVVRATVCYANREGHLPTGTWPNASLPPEIAFADGSARFIGDTISPRVFEALSTIAWGGFVSRNALLEPSVSRCNTRTQPPNSLVLTVDDRKNGGWCGAFALRP